MAYCELEVIGVAALRTVPLTRSCCDSDCLSEVANTKFDEGAIGQRAGQFGALGDQIRLKILQLLTRHEALCVCEIQEAFDVGQPTISHHLKLLRDADLVDVERRGTWAYYSLRKDTLKALMQELVAAL